MTAYHYSGRQAETADRSHFHGPSIISALARSDLGLIDEPMSFPWELVTDSISCPLVLNVAGCTNDQLTALRPALSSLTSFDTIIDRSNSASTSAKRLAEILGVRDTEPDASELIELQRAKQLGLAEQAILDRLLDEQFTVVIDVEDIMTQSIVASDLAGDQQVTAVAVRLPGEVIRSIRGGLATFAADIGTSLGAAQLRGLWGVRRAPGAPLDRGVMVLDIPPRDAEAAT